MADFNTAQGLVSVAEGAYGNDQRDAGNYTGGAVGVGDLIGTNFGISAPTLSNYLGRTATLSDMQNLTYATALQIYKANFWNAIGGDKLDSQSVANITYDGAVNEGVGAMSSILSGILTIPVSIPFSQTVIDTINNYPDQQDLFNKISDSRIAAYTAMNSQAYGAEWIQRVKNIVFSDTEAAISDTVTKIKNNPTTAILLGLTVVVLITGIIFRKRIINYFNKSGATNSVKSLKVNYP
jgi:lysozyme family protein